MFLSQGQVKPNMKKKIYINLKHKICTRKYVTLNQQTNKKEERISLFDSNKISPKQLYFLNHVPIPFERVIHFSSMFIMLFYTQQH